MDSVGKLGQLNINFFKDEKKNLSSISPFREVGKHDPQATNTGFNGGSRAERQVPSDAKSPMGQALIVEVCNSTVTKLRKPGGT